MDAKDGDVWWNIDIGVIQSGEANMLMAVKDKTCHGASNADDLVVWGCVDCSHQSTLIA